MALQITDLSFHYQQRAVLENVGFTAEKGKVIGILGENGSGKTTLLKLVASIERQVHGEILWKDTALSGMSATKRASLVAYLGQRIQPAWGMPAEDLVRLGVMHRMDWDESRRLLSVREAMQKTDVTHLSQRSVLEISSGELQRVLLARVIAGQPELILADEPTSGLDPRHQIEVLELLKAHARDGGVVLVVLHDLQAARQWCDEVVVLKNKGVAAFGPAGKTLTSDLIHRVFGI